MIQAISATKLHGTQNVQGLKGSQNVQKAIANHSTNAVQAKSATLSAMAADIKKAGIKNNGTVNFKGTKEELTQYLRYQIYSGDLNVEKGNHTKVVKTNDGTTYTVTLGKANKNDFASCFGGGKKASMTIKNHSDNTTESSSFSYDVEGFKSFASETKKYAEMKQKYGEI